MFNWNSTAGSCPFTTSDDNDFTAGCGKDGAYQVTAKKDGEFWSSQEDAKQAHQVVAAQMQLTSGSATAAQFGVRCAVQDNTHAYTFTVKTNGRWAIFKQAGDQWQILAKGDDQTLQSGSVALVAYCNPDNSLALEANGRQLGRAKDDSGSPYTGTAAGVIVSLEKGGTPPESVRVIALRITLASVSG
ncbi:hypothetical protein [Sinomonas sp. G460-2]|uniref:hypothetical protein n=1 Tax=Sinomonas sp. G460-2 TaxID=3393464 RepID=UPI0039F00316